MDYIQEVKTLVKKGKRVRKLKNPLAGFLYSSAIEVKESDDYLINHLLKKLRNNNIDVTLDFSSYKNKTLIILDRYYKDEEILRLLSEDEINILKDFDDFNRLKIADKFIFYYHPIKNFLQLSADDYSKRLTADDAEFLIDLIDNIKKEIKGVKLSVCSIKFSGSGDIDFEKEVDKHIEKNIESLINEIKKLGVRGIQLDLRDFGFDEGNEIVLSRLDKKLINFLDEKFNIKFIRNESPEYIRIKFDDSKVLEKIVFSEINGFSTGYKVIFLEKDRLKKELSRALRTFKNDFIFKFDYFRYNKHVLEVQFKNMRDNFLMVNI